MGPSRTVTLHWEGKERLDGAIPLPLETSSIRAWYGERGELLHGDNLVALRGLARSRPGDVTLAYLDPPFFTGRRFDHVERGTRIRRAAFDDRWADRAAYLEALALRLAQVRTLLAPHGSVAPGSSTLPSTSDLMSFVRVFFA